MKVLDLEKFMVSQNWKVEVGCDAEFKHNRAVAIKFAVRYHSKILVQTYYDPLFLVEWQKQKQENCKGIIIREPKKIADDLSPRMIIRDLFGISHAEEISKEHLDPSDHAELGPAIKLTIISHGTAKILLKIFGKKFLNQLMLQHKNGEPQIGISNGKVGKFTYLKSKMSRYTSPRIDSVNFNGVENPIEVGCFDINQAFQTQSFEELENTFLKNDKFEIDSMAEKSAMKVPHGDVPNPNLNYGYDKVVQTLLIFEKMVQENTEIYHALQLKDDLIAMRSTPGSRIADILLKSVQSYVSNDNKTNLSLKTTGQSSISKLSLEKVKNLMRRGSSNYLVTHSRSRFGEQIGYVHGGLQFSRTPDRLIHKGPGMICDVDINKCYNSAILGMNLYVGRPILWEPGSQRISLAQMIKIAEKSAAGRDGWIIYVSGSIQNFANTLIPSTRYAITTETLKSRRKTKNQKNAQSDSSSGRTLIYTDEINWGVIS